MQIELSYLTSYIDPDGDQYFKGKIYDIDDADKEKFFSQRDERGVCYFREFSPPPPPTEEELTNVVSRRRGRPPRADTGAVSLEGGGSKSPRKGVTIVKQNPAVDTSGEIDTGSGSVDA